MKNLLFILVFLFICFECESQPLYTCAECNCYLKSPCVDNPSASALCLTNMTLISCYDSTIDYCSYGCGIDSYGTQRCLCPRNCTGHGYCSSGTCICDDGYFGTFCEETDFCFGKSDGLHCDPNNSTQMIGCYNDRIVSYHYCNNCTDDIPNNRGYCNCPNDCSGNGDCSQASDTLGICECQGNFIGLDCSTNYTSCPQSLTVSQCSGKTLVNCRNGNVQSSLDCLSGCTTSGTAASCTCGSGCGSQGTCVDAGTCKCFNGYVGEYCTETTVCTGLSSASYVCVNSTTVGYCSSNALTSYYLPCSLGCYLGACICDSSTCINGYCLSTGECSCSTGWTGPKCNIPTSPSTPSAIPTNSTAGFCSTKIQGTYCDGDNLVSCSDNTFVRSTPCQYGCNSTLWGGSHSCQTVTCPPGYFGSACEYSDPCTNGTMSRFTGSQDFCVGNYVVSCSPTNVTSRIFCTNGCTASSVNGRLIATCNCACGPQGTDCDIYGNCECKKGWLSCPSGFTGDNCEIATNPCAGKTSTTICQSSNSSLLYCFNGVVSAVQHCSNGCAANGGCACANNCSGNGFCGPNGSCFCRTGYAGNDCAQALECTGKANGFVCDSDGRNLLTCMRDRMLYNVTCSGGCVDGACKCQYDCNGHGTCRQGVCVCNNGYAGDSCEIYLDSDIASVFIILIAVGLAASVGYALIIFFKTKVATPEIEMEQLRTKNKPNSGRLRISKKASAVLKLSEVN